MYYRLMKNFFAQSIARFLIYRFTSLLVIIFGSLFTITELIVTLIYFNYSDQIAGYTKYEFLLLIASFSIIGTLYEVLFINAHEDLSDKIIEGEMDYDLIRPVDAQFYNNLSKIEIPSLINLILPMILIGISLTRIQIEKSIYFVYYVLFIILGVYLYYLLNQLFVSLSFWIEKPGKILGIPEYLFEMANKPRMIFPRIWQLLFAWVIPVISTSNIALEVLTGQLDLKNLLAYLLSITCFTILVRVQWKLGLKRYVSAN